MEGNTAGYVPLFVWDTKMNVVDEDCGQAVRALTVVEAEQACC